MKTLLFSSMFFPLFVSAANIECAGFKMTQGQMTKPLLLLSVQTTSDKNVQKVEIYETNSNNQKGENFASGVLNGRLPSFEKDVVVLTLKNQTKEVSGYMTRGNGAFQGAITLELDDKGNGAFFRGCADL